LEIRSFPELASTQRYLIEALRSGELHAPVAVITEEQYDGVGSRENGWEGERGNFFASVALRISDLPEDLPLSSASIYFSFIMKKILLDYNDKVWLKWPNDLYLKENKIGGTITQKTGDILVCGIGINLKKTQSGYDALQSDVSPVTLLQKYLEALEEFPEWKQVFSEYQVEFEHSRSFSVHIKNRKKSLSDARLCEDGSLMIEGKRVYSLR
jgi:BirA family biotin operon repressor/biotin-[acetyl-CoA-carboxylase] ligase